MYAGSDTCLCNMGLGSPEKNICDHHVGGIMEMWYWYVNGYMSKDWEE